MDRLACVDLPALPLQLLLRRHPEWRDRPAAVVEQDRPQGVLLWVNERGRRSGVLPGQRYSAALALDASLVAAEVPPAEITAAVEEIAEVLRRFSPGVEIHRDEPGVFWLDAAGLERLFPSQTEWGQSMRKALLARELISSLVIGYARFGVYALARAMTTPALVVSRSATEEHAAMTRVPLTRIGIEPKARETLALLGVRTLGELLRLPSSGLRARFGAAVERLHQLGAGALTPPLAPSAAPESFVNKELLDEAESNREVLLFLCKQQLEPLLPKLAQRGHGVWELVATLLPERVSNRDAEPMPIEARLRPAEPTLDVVQLLGLLRLRLDSLDLPSGIVELAVEVIGAPTSKEQLQLFAQKPRRDPLAAARALARVRASLGAQSVVRAKLCDGHLPEARFTWEPVDKVEKAQPQSLSPDRVRPLVRRILHKIEALPPRPPREPDGWLLRGLGHGAVQRFTGPYLLSGAWWRGEIARDYYFAELRSGALSWVYYDKRRARWFRQGDVT